MTARGSEEAVRVSSEDCLRLKDEQNGKVLIAALQDSPCRDAELEAQPVPMPVRDVDL